MLILVLYVCVAGFVINGLRLFNLAAEGDPRVTISGDVQLEISPLKPHYGYVM